MPQNQISLEDDIQFWSRQMTEHGLFLNLMLEEPTLKAQALQLHQLWQNVMLGQADLGMALDELIAFKQDLIARQTRREWIGWALPSFIKHILMEAEYFKSRLTIGTTAYQDINILVRIVKEHAMVAPKLVDINQPRAEGQLGSIAGMLAQTQAMCSHGLEKQCIRHATANLEVADEFFVRKAPAAINVIHPVLLAHIVREGQRALQVSQMLQTGIQQMMF